MNKTLTILVAGLSLLAGLSLRGQMPPQPPPPNPYGSHPSVIQELERAQLTDADGKKRDALHYLRGKQFIGLYFSAHWCGPCRAFTPELVKFRNHCHKNNIPFEVVFVSFDKSKKDMREYMRSMKMKWPAAPFDSKLSKRLKEHFKVGGIPMLIIIDWRGEVISINGRGDVNLLGKDAYKKWQNTSQKLQPLRPPQMIIQPSPQFQPPPPPPRQPQPGQRPQLQQQPGQRPPPPQQPGQRPQQPGQRPPQSPQQQPGRRPPQQPPQQQQPAKPQPPSQQPPRTPPPRPSAP